MADMFRPVPIEQEPMLKNRFQLEFPSVLAIDSFIVQSTDKPKISITSIEIPYMNGYTYVAGKAKWSTINIKLLDVIGPSTSQKIMEWVNLHHEPATGRNGYAVGYKKNLVLNGLDGPGVSVQKWTMIGCQITEAGFDSYDYGAEEVSMPEITVQPDRCLLSV